MTKYDVFLEMARKSPNENRIIFSQWFYKLLDLNLVFQKKILMSHADDVINTRFKKGVRKWQKKEILKNRVPFQIFNV